MLTSALFAFLHFAAVFGIFATVFGTWLLLRQAPTCAQARQIQACDRWYGLCAAAVLGVGLLRVFYYEKGAAYYAGNPFFGWKMALFVLVGLLSIYPTVQFIRWGAQTRQGLPPVVSAQQLARLRGLLGLELALLLGVALCAALMAKGVTL
ncbi:putative membrane protein [Rhodoferax ferrireducens]|uniref:Membrane protein n=1 Tax=Rhodoferax ferrireducens TaxID=192843 RepID=A0ABU2C240_9BURK|nr:DUF2214 family protein [Rhodoferax ferrireducens]MDR7375379.1 putative membrane protein [Rhodoferax ferrireducens]